MPSEGFLQHFHDLAEAKEGVRCNAALAIKRALVFGSTNHKDTHGEELEYTVKRLIRGAQSSRACCRQGFSLALSELLDAFPQELPRVLNLVKELSALQTGLKPGEQKGRMLGRLCIFAAVLHSGCLKHMLENFDASKWKLLPQGPIKEIGRSLHELWAARPYMRPPVVQLLVQVCRELCMSSSSGRVPEALEGWPVDKHLRKGEKDLCPTIACLALELRTTLEDSNLDIDAQAGKGWPACVKDEFLLQSSTLVRIAQSISDAVAACPVGDQLPPAVNLFCRVWLCAVKNRSCQDHQSIWTVLDGALFPEKATAVAQAQSLRGLAEIAIGFRIAAARADLAPHVGVLLVGLFENMKNGISLLLRMLSWPRANCHAAAKYAQARLLEAVGAPQQLPEGGKKKDGANAATARTSLPELSLKDSVRLAILTSLQQHKAFGAMNGKFQRQWQQTLLAPLSAPAIRKRCASLLDSLHQADDHEDGLAQRGPAAQLEHLATHARAPDEVILAVLFRLFAAAYFVPDSGAGSQVGYSFEAFCSNSGFKTIDEGVDLVIPVLAPTCDTAAKNSAAQLDMFRTKFWGLLTRLARTTMPQMAENVIAKTAAGAIAVSDAESHAHDGAQANAPVVRTRQFVGCLNDGTLLLMRLHEWWEHIMERAPQTTSSDAPAATKKKRRVDQNNNVKHLRCTVHLPSSDIALQKKTLKVCRQILGESEAAGALLLRQRNAICGILLSLSLLILSAADDDERDNFRAPLEDVLSVIEELPAAAVDESVTQKKREKIQKQRAEVLAALPRIAAELFVHSAGLAKETAYTVWRELCEFTCEETLTSLSASVRDANQQDGEDGEDRDDGDKENEESDDEDEGDNPADAARAAMFQQATEQLKKDREEAAQKGKDGDGDSDADSDAQVLDPDGLLKELVGDDDDEGGGSSLLAAFASSGIEEAETKEAKLPRWQQRARANHEELTRKAREIELLELFLVRSVEKRPIGIKMMQELYEAVVKLSRRAVRKTADGEAGKPGKSKKRSKAEAMIHRMESDLAQRIVKLLHASLRQVCRWISMKEVCTWHSADDWKKDAHALVSLGGSRNAAAGGQKTLAVGAKLAYLFCMAHHALLVGPSSPSPEMVKKAKDREAWVLAEELLLSSIQDWSSGKKECQQWCEAWLNMFSTRAPHMLLSLPWFEHIRACKKIFVQKSQIAFVANLLLRCASSEAMPSSFPVQFADLCADLLVGTLDEGEDTGAAVSATQKKKLRRDLLRGLKLLLRVCWRAQKQGRGFSKKIPAEHIRGAVNKVRESLPNRRGELYQLCLHVLRSVQSLSGGGGATSGGSGSDGTGNKSAKSPHRKASGRVEQNSSPSDVAKQAPKQRPLGKRPLEQGEASPTEDSPATKKRHRKGVGSTSLASDA